MALHKDLNNNIHDDDNGKALHFLPDGCVEITQAEADTLLLPTQAELNAQRKQAIYAELSALDQKKIRPLSEGDAVYLAILNAQTHALRDEFKTL